MKSELTKAFDEAETKPSSGGQLRGRYLGGLPVHLHTCSSYSNEEPLFRSGT